MSDSTPAAGIKTIFDARSGYDMAAKIDRMINRKIVKFDPQNVSNHPGYLALIRTLMATCRAIEGILDEIEEKERIG